MMLTGSSGTDFDFMHSDLHNHSPTSMSPSCDLEAQVASLIKSDFCNCSGQLETEIEENDTVVFISTLHGG